MGLFFSCSSQCFFFAWVYGKLFTSLIHLHLLIRSVQSMRSHDLVVGAMACKARGSIQALPFQTCSGRPPQSKLFLRVPISLNETLTYDFNVFSSYLHTCDPPIVHGNLTCDTIFIQHNGLVSVCKQKIPSRMVEVF